MLAKMCTITECTNWQYRLHAVLGIHYKIAKACIKLGESSHSMQAFTLLYIVCLNYFFLGLRRAQPSSSKFGSSPLSFTLSLFWKNWRQSPVSS